MRGRGALKLIASSSGLGLVLAGGLLATGPLPYPVRPESESPVRFALEHEDEHFATAALAWSATAFILEIAVKDATPFSLADAGVELDEAYRADSVEFWINRRQFVLANTPQGLQVFDYVHQEIVPGCRGTWTARPDGYELRAAIPWAALGVVPNAKATFQFALQINDRLRNPADGGWKQEVRQTLFPEGAIFDRPSTYGTVFLQQRDPDAPCATAPLSFARLNVRSYAYEKTTDCFVQRMPAFTAAHLVLRVLDPAGKLFGELPVPAGAGEQRLPLPWDERQTGIFSAALYLVDGDESYGPIAEPYFNAGPTAIAEYRSSRHPPADLAQFWAEKIAAMRQRPFAAVTEAMDAPWPATVVDQVRLQNHRGAPLIVYVSRRTEDTGKLLAELNVYPPMAAAKPVAPRAGRLGVTFCGSRQGACRGPDQKRNENLWARAASLDDCYWLDVVLDGVRVMDYLASRPDSAGRVIVSGGSRGGWYAFALAAVAPDRVALARFTSPCYSDVTMNQRLGSSSAASEIYTTFERDRVKTGGRVFQNFRYFDPLFLAGLIRTPVVFSAGLQDHICSAIGMTAAANRIGREFCTFVLDSEAGHGGSPWMHPIEQAVEERVVRQKGN